MVAKIGPLVKMGRRNRIAFFHALGGITGGVFAGVAFGFLGLLLYAISATTVHYLGLVAVPTALAYGGLADLRLLPPSPGRQTPASWQCSLGREPASFAWGVDLALGVSTRFPHMALLALPIFAVAAHSLFVSIGLFVSYGLVRSAVVALLVTSGIGHSEICDFGLRHQPQIRSVVGGLALIATLTVVLLS